MDLRGHFGVAPTPSRNSSEPLCLITHFSTAIIGVKLIQTPCWGFVNCVLCLGDKIIRQKAAMSDL